MMLIGCRYTVQKNIRGWTFKSAAKLYVHSSLYPSMPKQTRPLERDMLEVKELDFG